MMCIKNGDTNNFILFVERHELNCVIDEVYGCSIYDSSVENSSVLSFDPEELPDKSRTHVLWGMAKVYTSVIEKDKEMYINTTKKYVYP